MKRILMFGVPVMVLAVILVAVFLSLGSEKGQVCLNKHQDNLIGCLLAPPVALNVQVSGSVDEFIVYRVDDGAVMGRIVTNGQDVTQTIYLSTAYRYYFQARKGNQTQTGKPRGFATNEARVEIKIFAFDHWE